MMDETTDGIFCDLMELPPGERLAALDAMADLLEETKAAIRRMLADEEVANAYFSRTAVVVRMLPTSSHAEGEGEGEMCGLYKLIRKLGEGGFGTVWLAEQERPLKRTVAVKVIKAGMDTAEVLARFDAEKQALARMDHPNIAKVLDAGMTERGRPFFVMELVGGSTITRYCQEKRLGMPERLRLFGDVCSALHHAHQKGVIHRDIKPSNVIVTETGSRPVAKVIDFGIAKAIEGSLTDQTLRTRVEQWIGTPAYMSPEQAALGATDVDTRSDIYALGVLLYELITGDAPFDSETLMKAGYEEMRRIIREVDPPRPSARIATAIRTSQGTQSATANHATARGLASELDWIVMKAIEKSRERRYESAAALADDVARYLADEPVTARPPSSWYLLSKFSRRHRLGIHILSGFLALVVGAGLLSVWLALRASDAEGIARERLATALKERNARNQALEDAQAVSQLLADVFQHPPPGEDGRKVTVLEALDAAAESLEVLLAGQPRRQAMLRGVLAESYGRLGIHERCLALREKNLQTHQELSGANHREARMALRAVVEAAEDMGDSQAALRYARMENETPGQGNVSLQETLAAKRSLIRGLFGVGEREQAIALQRELVGFCERAFGADSARYERAAWELRQHEARVLDTLGREFSELMARHGPTHDDTIEARLKLAKTLLIEGHTIEALLHLEALQPITLARFGALDDRTLEVHRTLVRVFDKLTRGRDGVKAQRFIVAALRERDGGMASSTINAEDRLERLLFYAGPAKERREYIEDLLRRRIGLFGEDHPDTVMIRLKVGAASPEEAVRIKENAIRVMREAYGEKDRSTAEAMASLARLYAHQGKTREALKLFARCGPNMLDDTWLNFEAATHQLWSGEMEDFRTTRRNILGYWERRIPVQKSSPEMFDRAMWLACIAEPDDEPQKLVLKKLLDHVDQVRQGLHVEAQERFPKPLQNQIRGCVLYRLGKNREALAAFNQSLGTSHTGQEIIPYGHYGRPTPWVRFFMAMAEYRLGNTGEAKRLYESGEALLVGTEPSRENTIIPANVGGEALTQWIMRNEAKALIFGE